MERSSGNPIRVTGLVLAGILYSMVLSPSPLLSQDLETTQDTVLDQTISVTHWEPYGDAANRQTWLSDSLRRLMTKDLSRIGEINVVAAGQYEARISGEGLRGSSPNDADNARKIANASRADLLLIGTYQIQGDQIQLSAVIYDPFTEKTLVAHSERGRLNKIKSLETKLLKKLLRKAGVSLGTREINWLERSKSMEPDNLDFESPRNRPEVLDRDRDQTSMLNPGGTVPEGLNRRNLVVGLHWPGFSLGYQPTAYSTVEFRAEANSDITVLGGRYNYHFYHFGESNVYWGTQISHIDFEGDVSGGEGVLGGGFLGFEQYATTNLSFKADVGTYLTNLEDDSTGVSDSGVGFSLVTGVALHFF